ncbi:MAG: DNA repair protein RadC [Verrucomicrobiae bacterium]|nr:DNA repair protein RadC [Verrucomicrobiae bacterium]
MKIHDLPEHERPRELLVNRGADNLSNVQLLAILLRTGTKGHSVLAVAEELLAKFQNLRNLVEAPLEELTKVHGVGRDKAVTLKAAFTLAKRLGDEIRREAPLLNSPERVVEAIRDQFIDKKVETFWVVLLNSRRRLISFEKVSEGTLDTVVLDPRSVFYPAIRNNASAIILVHNHPSGDPSPSNGDIQTTKQLIRAGETLKIEVLDHIIIGSKFENQTSDFISLRNLGHFRLWA